MKAMEVAMNRTMTKPDPDRTGEEVVLMYPGNALMAQVRTFAETQSIFKVVWETFFAKPAKT